MQEIIITIAPFAQGYLAGCASTFVLWGFVVWGLVATSKRAQKKKGVQGDKTHKA